jgi:hypothetical protein
VFIFGDIEDAGGVTKNIYSKNDKKRQKCQQILFGLSAENSTHHFPELQ